MKPVWIFLNENFFMLPKRWRVLVHAEISSNNTFTPIEKTSQTTFIGVDWRFVGAVANVLSKEK